MKNVVLVKSVCTLTIPCLLIHGPTRKLFEITNVYFTNECGVLVEVVDCSSGEKLTRLPTDFTYFEQYGDTTIQVERK